MWVASSSRIPRRSPRAFFGLGAGGDAADAAGEVRLGARRSVRDGRRGADSRGGGGHHNTRILARCSLSIYIFFARPTLTPCGGGRGVVARRHV